jgi:hypothetical protein
MNTPILISSFCRPNLTLDALRNALSLNGVPKIYVSHDGPIRGFYENEHEQTREMLLVESRKYSNVELILRETNRGITNHLIDSMELVLEKYPAVVFLEEDMELSQSGYDFLSAVTIGSTPEERIAYYSTGHKPSASIRSTRFPEQWGISLNASLFQEFKLVSSLNSVNWEVISKSIKSMEVGFLQKIATMIYWHRLFTQELNQPHGWDACLQYATWKSGAKVLVISENAIKDTVTTRNDPGGFTNHVSGGFKPKEHSFEPERENESLCSKCEELDILRREITLNREIKAVLKIRSRTIRFFKVFLLKYIGINNLTQKFLK